jgi:alpha-galactosidase
MVGYGNSEDGNGGPGGPGCLRYLASNNATYPEYDYASLLVDPGQPATSAWKNRDKVKVWWHNGQSGDLGGLIGSGDLLPIFGKDAGKFGPEYAFGQVLGDHYASDDILIIKAAWGGRYLFKDFRPPSAVAARGGVVGPFYEAIFDDAREVLLNLGTVFPEWSDRGYQIVGFAWHQGFSDKTPAERANEYKDNLPDLISDVRAEFGKPDLPFVIATTGMADAGPVDTTAPYDDYHPVERAQLWDAGVAQPANTLTDDTRGYWENASVSPFDQGYHWNHNARSYFRVGLGLGNDMVTLLSAP